MHTPSEPPAPVQKSVYVSTKVEKDWLSDSYLVFWSVVSETEGVLRTLARGTETFGPLWAPEQVERLVSALCDRLRSLDWSAHDGAAPFDQAPDV